MSNKIKTNSPGSVFGGIEREMEGLKKILTSMETLTDHEKKRVLTYLKNKYASIWPNENY